MSTKIWYEKPVELYQLDNYLEVLPFSNMTIEQQLNAVFRLFIYLGILLALVKADYRYLFVAIIAGLVTVVLYEYEKYKRSKAEKFLEDEDLDVVNNSMCTRSTIENPFMNPSIVDITDNPSRPKACHVTSPEVQAKIEENYNARVFQDVNDIWNTESSQREFYTVANTMIPNDQESFANWLYKTGKTCKEGNGLQCYENLPEDTTLYGNGYIHRRYNKNL